MLAGPVKAQGRAPIVNDQRNVIGDAELFPRGEQVVAVFDVPVAVRARVVELVGVAHANQVHRDTAAVFGQCRHDVAPQVRRGWVTVLQDDWIAFTHLDKGHAFAIYADELLRVFVGRDHCRIPLRY